LRLSPLHKVLSLQPRTTLCQGKEARASARRVRAIVMYFSQILENKACSRTGAQLTCYTIGEASASLDETVSRTARNRPSLARAPGHLVGNRASLLRGWDGRVWRRDGMPTALGGDDRAKRPKKFHFSFRVLQSAVDDSFQFGWQVGIQAHRSYRYTVQDGFEDCCCALAAKR